MPEKRAYLDKDLSISQLIQLAREAGFDFGRGDPVNRLRYYTKIGLIPHAIRKQSSPGQSFTTGYYPAYTLGLLLKIQNERYAGEKVPDLQKVMKQEQVRAEVRALGDVPELPKQSSFFVTKLGTICKKAPKAVLTGLVALFLTGASFALAGRMMRAPQDLGQGSQVSKGNPGYEEQVLAAATASSSSFLEINEDMVVNGKLNLRGVDLNIDQDLLKTSSPTFSSLVLSAPNSQIKLGTGRIITLPDADTTLVGTGVTQTLTNKSMSGSSNTFTNIPNSALTNSKVTVTAGTNLTGGGDVSLGSSITLSLSSDLSISSATISGNLGVVGDATVSGTLTVGGNLIANPSGISGYWQRALGAVSPTNITDDLLIGGTSTASAKLQVSGTTGYISAGTWQGTTVAVGYGGTGVTSLSDVLGTSNQITVSGGTGRVIGGNVTLSLPNDVALVNATASGNMGVGGELKTNQFRLLTAPTAGYVLVADSNGIGTWQAITSGPGGIAGSGTNGYLARFTPDGSHIGNASIADTGTSATASGTLGVGSNLTVIGSGTFGNGLNVAGPVNLPSSSVTNTMLANSTITVANGSGIGVSGSPVALGGTVTISNTGVLSIAGTANQITANAGTGNVILSLPNDLQLVNATTSGTLGVGGSLTVTSNILPTYNGTQNIGSPTNYFQTVYANNLISGSSGTSGYWQRTGTTISTANAGDTLSLGGGLTITAGNIAMTGSQTIDTTGTMGVGTVGQTALTIGRDAAPTTINGSTITFDGALIATNNTATFSAQLGVGGEASLSAKLVLNSLTPMITTTNSRDLQLLNSGNYITPTGGYLNNQAICTAAGNCAGIGGTVGGTGTQNYIAKWNNAGGTTIGNSGITDTGSLITFSENATASGTLGVGGNTQIDANLNVKGDVTLNRVTAGSWQGSTLTTGYGGTGVTSLSDVLGTSNQISVSGGTGRVIGGNVTLSLPNDLSFVNATASGNIGVGGELKTNQFRLLTAPSAGYVLVSDATGIGTWQSVVGGGVGGVGGSGTLNTLSKFTPDGNHIGDSGITDTGTLITLSENATASGTFGIGSNLTAIGSGTFGNGLNVTGPVSLPSSSITNAMLANSSITVSNGSGIGVSGSPVSLGGTVTISNTGVLSITGTANQITASVGTGNVTLSLPNDLNLVNATASGNLGVGGEIKTNQFRLLTAPSAGYVLVSDATGIGTWQSVVGGGVGGVGGSGTLNTLSKFTPDGNHIGNSNITDTGTLITLGSNATVSGTLGTHGLTATGLISLPASSITNTMLANSSITVSNGSGIGVSGSPVALGGTVTISNTGVLSITGTANQITANVGTGNVTLSLPNDLNLVNATASGNLGVGGEVKTNQFRLLTAPSAGYVLVSDATGIGTWQAITGGPGGIGGSGSINKMAKFTAGQMIGDSSITDTGSLITLGVDATASGNLNVGGEVNTKQFRLNTAPSAGYVLVSDAAGIGTWQSVVGGGVGGIGGSGTANTMAKFTGAGVTIGNSNITDTGSLITLGVNATASGTFGIGSNLTTIGSGTFGNGLNVTGPVSLPNSSITNLMLANSSITVSNGSGIGVSGSPVALGGTVTISNTGVLSITGTANQITANVGTGNVTLSLPNDLNLVNATASGTLGVGGNTAIDANLNVKGDVTLNRVTAGSWQGSTLTTGYGGTGVTSLSDVLGTANQITVGNGTGRVIGGNVTLSLPAAILLGAGPLDATAILQLDSTTKGFLGPRMTLAQREAIVTPATGLLIYNTDTNQYNVYNGTTWGAVGGASAASQWQLISGVISPFDISQSLAIGGTATDTAKFLINGVNGNASSSGTLTLNSAGQIQTTNNQTLTLGGDATGNIILKPNNITLATFSPTSLNLNNLPILNIGDAGTDFSAQGGLTLANALTISAGGIALTGSQTIDATGTLGIGTVNQTALTLGRSDAPTTIDGSTITINGTLMTRSGNATISGSLGAGGDASFSGKLTFDSLTPQINATNMRNLQLGFMNTGRVEFGSALNYITSGGNLNLAGTVTAGTYNLQTISSASSFTGTATISGTLGVGGNTTINADLLIKGNTNLITGSAYQINNASVLNATTLGSGVTGSSLTSVGILTGGSIASGFGTIATANTITGTTINGTTGINTGAGAGTNRIDVSGNLANIGNITATGTLSNTGTATISGLLGAGGGASLSGKLTIDSLTAQINATNDRSIDLGFMNTGRIDFITTSSYVDASGNFSTNGQIQVGNFASAPTALGAGAIYYDTTNSRLYAYNGSAWGALGDENIVSATNTSGGSLANRALVIFDNSNNNSVTTTTTAYKKAAYGVINGAACANAATCQVQVGGSAKVTITNTTTVTKGDYVYTSATAGSAVTSAKLFDGMIGVVTDTSTSGSGYVTMTFQPQAQVTAGVAIDKGSKHNEYWLLAKNYLANWDGTSPNQNIPPRGLMFDNFSDLTKVDAVNTTVSGASGSAQIGGVVAPFRVGLTGGQTMSTSTTDNAGNTYLGSNTVNKVFYYDRTRDSIPQVQVELGIDPNWYNGVTLSVATTSANMSQNDVIQKNANLTTTYNGSLVKVTGTYGSTAASRTIYLTVTGNGNSFSWTDYNGNAGVLAMTPSTSQSLGSTGVSITFSNARYNPGDVFKIGSWVVEPFSSTRGARAAFPERSNIIANASGVDIIDADTQKLWMRFSTGTNFALGATANNTPNSVNMLNGKLYSANNGSAGALYEIDYTTSAMFKRDATNWSLSNQPIAQRNGTNTYNVLNTSNILVNTVANDVSAAVIPNQPTQNITVSGWGYFALSAASETVNLPYKFNGNPNIVITSAGHSSTTAPVSLSNCSNASAKTVVADTITTTTFVARESAADATNYQCYTWTATGVVSPRQYVAVATNGGTSLINETDGSVVNSADTGTMTNVTFAGTNLYAAKSGQIDIYYGPGGAGASYAANKTLTTATIPSLPASTTTINSLSATAGTSTIDGKSNTVYIGTTQGAVAYQEAQGGANGTEGSVEASGSVKYYTKDYISEEMVGNIQGMWGFNSALTDSSVKGATITAGGATITYPTGVRGKGINITSANGTATVTTVAANYSMGLWVKETTGWTYYVKTDVGTYINGVLSSTAFTNRMTWATTTVTLVAGTQDVDEMFATNSTLTPGQIKHMYEVGYRALQNHSGGDTNQQLAGTTNVVGDARVDFNNQYMYVGTNDTTNGRVSKVDLNSDTDIKTFDKTANVPVGGTLLANDDTKSLAVGYNLEAVGSAASGAVTMAPNETGAGATSGNLISKTLTTPESFNQAYLWAQYTLDSSDASNTVQVWATNDGTNYYQCNLTNTDANQTPNEYEYFCQFNTAGSTLKTKFVFARGSTKTNTYVTRYGIAWIGTDSVVAGTAGNGLYTNNNATVANGSYIDVAHNQGTNDVVTDGWVNLNGQWKNVSTATESGVISATNATVADGSYVEVVHNQQTSDLLSNGWVYNTGTSQWEGIDNKVVPTFATGGTIATSSGFTTHTFTTVGTASFTPNGVGKVDYLVVGGGGGGGSTFAGGGGAGGMLTATGFVVTAQGYTVTVGAGGTGAAAGSPGAHGTSGNDSVFGSVTATGGGYGGGDGSRNGANGGSGGGCADSGPTCGVGIGGQGNNGSLGYNGTTVNSSGGGGGGASAIGGVGTANVPGNGGNGTASSISGSSVTYAGGGGGGSGTSSSSGGTGGAGGGGNGGLQAAGSAGTANTGGGGGGGAYTGSFLAGGNGGSGIVIVRYATDGLLIPAFKVVQVDANTVRLYNYSGSTQNLRLDVSTQAYQIKQVDTNTVRLWNYSGATQNLRLDVITGGLGRNLGTVSLAPAAADVNSQNNTNAIWINNTGTGGNLIKLQTSGIDKFNIDSSGNASMAGNLTFSSPTTISTTAKQSLTLGDSNTGDLNFYSSSNKLTSAGNLTLAGTITATGNLNSSGGSLQTNGITRIDNSGNITAAKTTTTDLALVGQASAPGSPSEGQVYFNSTDKEYYVYKNAKWTRLVADDRGSCPTGYILVPGSTTFGTKDFCVMKYDAKQDASKNPTSTATGAPWVSVDWDEARAACQRAGAHLITNAEWMTIARNIEATAINDMDDDAGLQLATGHSDNSPASALATTAGADPVVSGCTLTSTMENASNVYSAGVCEIRGTGSGGSTDNDKGYYGTGQQWSTTGYSAGTANKSQLRTSILSNGQVIWDFAGNVWQWSDWQCGGSVWNTTGWLEWNNAGLTDYETSAAGPLTSSTSVNGTGEYYGCTVNRNAAIRGGSWSDGALAGPFTLRLDIAPSPVSTSLGFRCAK